MKPEVYRLAVVDYPPDLRKWGLELKEVLKANCADYTVRRRYENHIVYTASVDNETLTYIYLRWPELKSAVNPHSI